MTYNVAIIPARAGSARIPGKNRKLFHGRPIICYSIAAAQVSGLFKRIIVSTDDEALHDIAKMAGAEVMERSEERARDTVGTQEVALEVLSHIRGDRPIDYACVIYATAPMIDSRLLQRAHKMLERDCEAAFAFGVGTEPLHDAGQFYYGRAECFLNQHPLYSVASRMVPIPKERVCDINTPEDWVRAEKMFYKMRLGGWR